MVFLFLFILFFHAPAQSENNRWTSYCRIILEEAVIRGKNISEIMPGPGVKTRPLFVTLKKLNTTRGCAGTLQPLFSTIGEELSYFTVKAATSDSRYPPVRPDELKDIAVIITFPGELRAVNSIREYNPWKHGLLVRKDGREGVILPCEGKTGSYALRKAIVQSGIDEIKGADIYIFECETITEKIK